MQQLTNGTLLQGGKYKIERVLGQGGFGITYLAQHEILDSKVAIKEFFFKEYCDRDDMNQVSLGTASNKGVVERFQQKFIKEAKTIFKLHHPNIIQIHDIFTENGTAYYVMEYVEGESLGDVVNRTGTILENEAINYIKKVGDALSYIHSQSINHLDVKPSNIMVRRSDNQVVLIDFGVAKQYDAETREGTTTTPVGISHGYSPLEQYRVNGVQEFSPQSDVYALAATLFKLLTGITPPEAIEVQEEGIPVEELKSKGISADTINAIEEAMQSRKKRTQTVAKFLEALGGSGTYEDGVKEEVNKEETTIFDDAVWSEEEDMIGEDCNEKEDETVLIAEKFLPELVKEDIHPVLPEEKEFCSKYGLNLEGKEAVDLGLSVLWCSCNIGAVCPASSGNLESWAKVRITDYLDWRLPSTEEYKELKEKCNWKWIDEDGICGYLITSPTTGKSIFLRASGKNDGEQTCNTNIGFYWSDSLSISADNAYCTTFMPGTILCHIQNPLSLRMSMRLVRKK